jgi:hypothetical protein
MHKSFSGSKNFGFASGLEFDFNAINFQSSPSSDSIFYNYSDTEILPSTNTSEDLFLLESRKHKITQITIPLALLFRTDANGHFRYYTKFGIKNSFFAGIVKFVSSFKTVKFPLFNNTLQSICFKTKEKAFGL